MVHNHSLSIEKYSKYRRKYTEPEDIEHARYPYDLGDLYMDRTLLTLVKEALIVLHPDSFYFSPTRSLFPDVCEGYEHIKEQLNKVKEITLLHWVQSYIIYKRAKNNLSSNPLFISIIEKVSTLYFTILLYNNL